MPFYGNSEVPEACKKKEERFFLKVYFRFIFITFIDYKFEMILKCYERLKFCTIYYIFCQKTISLNHEVVQLYVLDHIWVDMDNSSILRLLSP